MENKYVGKLSDQLFKHVCLCIGLKSAYFPFGWCFSLVLVQCKNMQFHVEVQGS